MVAYLTEAHRLAQARVGAETIRMMLTNWATIDPAELTRTLERWLSSSERIIVAQHARSAGLAAKYTELVHKLEVGPNLAASDLLTVTPAEALTSDQMRPSLLVTGPGRLREAIRKGSPLEVAAEKAQAASARSAQRMAVNGGRETIIKSAVGYRRVTSGKPCPFCAMLASRGAVYGSEASAGFLAHDGCNCHPEPVFREGRARDDESKKWAETYEAAQAERKAGLIEAGGKNPQLNALRTYMRRNGLI